MNPRLSFIVTAAAILLAGSVQTLARDTAGHQGRVYLDRNGNGIYDKTDKALPEVAVSDGLNVVKTASDGTFTLPGHARERFIHVSTPSGYIAAGNYYQPVDATTEVYDFPLVRAPHQPAKDGSHLFVHISDSEISGNVDDEHEPWLSGIREYIANEGAAFLIHTGDICYEKGLRSHLGAMNSSNMGTPVYYTIGNHDLLKGDRAEGLFEEMYGPVYYSFNVGNTHYVILPILHGDNKPVYTKADVYAWLRNDLAMMPKGASLVIFEHDLPDTGDKFDYSLSDQESIDLREYGLKAWIYGHIHHNRVYDHGGVWSIGTATPAAGGIDHSPAAFRAISVDGKGNVTSQLRYPYIDKSVEIASIGNGMAPVNANGSIPLSVNAYSTSSPTASVSCRCEAGGRMVVKDLPLRQNSDFNWSADMPLPADMSGKQMTVTVSARFRNGEVAQVRRSLVYDPVTFKVEAGDDWCTMRRDAAHSGRATDSLVTPLRPAWVSNVGANIFMCSPVISDGRVYVASVDDSGQDRAAIVAMDMVSGNVVWRYPLRSSVRNSIAVAEGLVFAQDADGMLYALDASTGSLAWQKQLNVMKVIPMLMDGLTVDNGILYAGSGKGLCALRCTDGKELWTNTAWEQREGTPATIAVGNGVLVASVQWQALYAHDAATGQLLWQASDHGLRHRASTPVMDSGLIYLTSSQSLFIIDAVSGNIIVERQLPFSVDACSSPLLTPDEIIFGTPRNGIVALDRRTLEQKWSFRTGNALIYTIPYFKSPGSNIEASPVLAGDNVYIGGADGVLYALDRKTGSVKWKHATGAPVLATCALSGNTVVAADYGGNVYAFRAPSKQ